MIEIRDERQRREGVKIKELAEGSYFTEGMQLFLKAAYDVVVDMQAGLRVAFNEEHYVIPVSRVRLTILK